MDLGLPAGAAKAIWMPVPMVLMLIAATMECWLQLARAENFRRSTAADWSRLHGALWFAGSPADGLKLVFKEDPAKADSLLFTLGPIIVVIPVFVLFDCAVWTEPGNH